MATTRLKDRLLDLMKVQCRVFNQVYNPTQARMGTKVLRQRLRGPSVIKYYPPKKTSVPQLLGQLRKNMPHDDIDTWDDFEDDRQEQVIALKLRGKGPPKKKRKAEGRTPFAKCNADQAEGKSSKKKR